MTDAQFLLAARFLGAATWTAAALWSRWDLKRAVRKAVIEHCKQEHAIKRLTGGEQW